MIKAECGMTGVIVAPGSAGSGLNETMAGREGSDYDTDMPERKRRFVIASRLVTVFQGRWKRSTSQPPARIQAWPSDFVRTGA
jgi:hypothetical protein